MEQLRSVGSPAPFNLSGGPKGKLLVSGVYLQDQFKSRCESFVMICNDVIVNILICYCVCVSEREKSITVCSYTCTHICSWSV